VILAGWGRYAEAFAYDEASEIFYLEPEGNGEVVTDPDEPRDGASLWPR